MHPIDASSPLYGLTKNDLISKDMAIIIHITGFDEDVAHDLQAHKRYVYGDLQWQHRFVDILRLDADRVIHVDYEKFHQTEPV